MKNTQTEHVDLPEQTEAAIEEAERLLRVARGENVDERLSRTPWDFNLPTGEDLRAMRERCGLSMQEAADMMDYEYQTVNSYETGNGTPGREFLRRALILYKREWPRHD